MLPLRLRSVAGLEGRANDVLFQPATRPPNDRRTQTLIFFGGDMQDYPEVMHVHRENRSFMKWNLENTARMLSSQFPHKHIVVVRPSRVENLWIMDITKKVSHCRVEYKSFSCYDNFVPCNSAGVPDHTPNHSALHHLERLLQSVSNRLKAYPTSELLEAVSSTSLPEDIDIEELHQKASIHHCVEQAGTNGAGRSAAADHKPALEPLWWREGLALEQGALTLVGFSKGCVVLNQFIYEFHYTQTLTPGDTHMMRLMGRVSSMYWLDGGHAGGKNTWITARSLLETLTRLDMNIYVHVSPYQVEDEARPWIGREERAFTTLLKKLGAKVNRYLHGGLTAARTLQMHFEVLAHFHLAHRPRHPHYHANPLVPRHPHQDDEDE